MNGERERRCRYCNSLLILDPNTYSYVCPVCGVVYDYEMVPSYYQLSHTSPLTADEIKLEKDVVARARRLFGELVAKELTKMGEPQAEEVLTALDALVNRREHRVSWSAVRKAVEIASKYNIKVDLEEAREKKIQAEIERFVADQGLDIDHREVWFFAVRYKHLWAGRKSSTIAKIFTYLYCKKRLNIEIKLDGKHLKIARALERVLEYE